MTLAQLEYVVSVAKHRNFTQAAENSFVTQPTLSMQIQKLEKELDIEIFDRSVHPIKLTQIGEKVVTQAQNILTEAAKIDQMVREEKGLLEGDFTIGVLPTILPTLVPLFYKHFKKNHPKVNLIIKELQTAQIIKGLEDGSLDFAIAVTPLDESSIIENPLYYEPMVAYVPKTHPLNSQDKININELNRDDLLLMKKGNCFRNNVLSLCGGTQGQEQTIKLDSGNLDTLIKLANEGYGITLLPILHTEDLSDEFKKNIRNFIDPVPTREVSLLHHHSNLRHSFEQSLFRSIRAVMRGKIFVEKIGNVTSPLISLPV